MNMHNQMPPEAQLTQMLTGCLISQAVYVAAKLGIADLLKDAPQTVTLLAEKTATHERSLYRILRSLASMGVFTETAPRVFALTPLAEPLLSSEAGSFRDVAIFTGENWHWALYGEMLYSVKTGKSACEKVHGMKAFPYLQQNPEAFETFNRGMSSYSSSVVPTIVEACDLSQAETVVDVAGGHGVLLAGFLRKNPSLKGILFDLPEVVAGASALFEKEAVPPERIETVGGDFFAAVPAGGDVYLIKHIIHDWDDEHAIKILSNVAQEMNPQGKVLLVELVLPEGNEPHYGKILDLEMMVSPGGAERTLEEYCRLLTIAQLKFSRLIPTKSPLSIIEAVRAKNI